jgi:hypothetical protein
MQYRQEVGWQMHKKMGTFNYKECVDDKGVDTIIFLKMEGELLPPKQANTKVTVTAQSRAQDKVKLNHPKTY